MHVLVRTGQENEWKREADQRNQKPQKNQSVVSVEEWPWKLRMRLLNIGADLRRGPLELGTGSISGGRNMDELFAPAVLDMRRNRLCLDDLWLLI